MFFCDTGTAAFSFGLRRSCFYAERAQLVKVVTYLLATLVRFRLEIGGRPARCKVDERPDDDAARAAAAAAAAKARLDGSPS